MKRLIKRLLPPRFLDVYHRLMAAMAGWRYGWPSEEMVVIGVTGTNGKSTTVNLITAVLEGAGHKVGATSTVNFRVAGEEWLNDTKMTMLGRFRLQRLLRRMADAGCRYAVVETSSEGIKQHRHSAINYDLAVFTNLTPEHLESHGGFDNYREAKGRLFARLAESKVKTLDGRDVAKTAIINLADDHAGYFLNFPVRRKVGFRLADRSPADSRAESAVGETVIAEDLELTDSGSVFAVRGQSFRLKLLGRFNVENALAAVAVGLSQGVGLATISAALERIAGVPGRLEFIDAGQPFTVLVDYAPEPESLKKLYEVLAALPKGKLIHVLGSCGGGRDRARRPILGRLAAENADIVIVTNEDPYDDDPMLIIKEVAAGATACGKVDGKDLHLILDRGKALAKAVSLAGSGDIVVVTGKGAEQAIVTRGGKKLPWDDRDQLRLALSAAGFKR